MFFFQNLMVLDSSKNSDVASFFEKLGLIFLSMFTIFTDLYQYQSKYALTFTLYFFLFDFD